jgi:hypothetical protein
MLDEVQRAPDLLRAVKRAVDEDRRPGRFLLTGSTNLLLLRTVSETSPGAPSTCTLARRPKARSPGQPGALGMVVHTGPDLYRLSERVLAAPLARLVG